MTSPISRLAEIRRRGVKKKNARSNRALTSCALVRKSDNQHEKD